MAGMLQSLISGLGGGSFCVRHVAKFIQRGVEGDSVLSGMLQSLISGVWRETAFVSSMLQSIIIAADTISLSPLKIYLSLQCVPYEHFNIKFVSITLVPKTSVTNM